MQKNIEWSTLENQEIPVPSMQEQAVIGTFFEHIDNLITLQQRGNTMNRREKMLNEYKANDLFYQYYEDWITV